MYDIDIKGTHSSYICLYIYKTAISYVNSPKSYVQQSEKGCKTIKQ